MKNARYDIRQLRADIRHIAEEIRRRKTIIHASGYQPTWREYRDYFALKDAATMLCCLRAHHRGKMHLRDEKKSLEHAQLLEPKYLLKKVEVAA